MTKPLNERLASAIGSMNARIGDMEALLAEVDAEAGRLGEVVAQAARDSIDFTLPEDLRDKAAADGDRARRNAAALSQARKQLEARLIERRDSESAVLARRERERIVAERDALAERLREEWPTIEAAIVELLSAVQANDAALIAHRLPEISAEAVARGIPGNFRIGVDQVPRLTDIVLPAFGGRHSLDRAWPVPQQRAHFTDAVHQSRIAMKEQMREAQEREAASWSPFVVSGDPKAHGIAFRGKPSANWRIEPMLVDAKEPRACWLQAETVERLRAAGCKVEPAQVAKKAEGVQLPTSSVTF